jgi:hypothetical protein
VSTKSVKFTKVFAVWLGEEGIWGVARDTGIGRKFVESEAYPGYALELTKAEACDLARMLVKDPFSKQYVSLESNQKYIDLGVKVKPE